MENYLVEFVAHKNHKVSQDLLDGSTEVIVLKCIRSVK